MVNGSFLFVREFFSVGAACANIRSTSSIELYADQFGIQLSVVLFTKTLFV